MADTNAQIQALGEIARLGRPVKFFNTYHGIPINYEGRILSVETQIVSAIVHEYQAVCMIEDQYTYLQSDRIASMLRARCLEVDISAKEVRLTDFKVSTTSAGRRVTVRVVPKEPAEAEIYNSSGQRIPGILADISTSGIGILTFAAYVYGKLVFSIGSEVFADVQLYEDEMVRFQGTVASIQERGRFTHRIGLQLQPETASEAALRTYIALRQEELLLELKQKYQILCNQPRKKNAPLT